MRSDARKKRSSKGSLKCRCTTRADGVLGPITVWLQDLALALAPPRRHPSHSLRQTHTPHPSIKQGTSPPGRLHRRRRNATAAPSPNHSHRTRPSRRHSPRQSPQLRLLRPNPLLNRQALSLVFEPSIRSSPLSRANLLLIREISSRS